ncbi:hypothetical protein PMIN06_007717 [Paraphaeosphaeria minitans]
MLTSSFDSIDGAAKETVELGWKMCQSSSRSRQPLLFDTETSKSTLIIWKMFSDNSASALRFWYGGSGETVVHAARPILISWSALRALRGNDNEVKAILGLYCAKRFLPLWHTKASCFAHEVPPACSSLCNIGALARRGQDTPA